ncbi:hypothetical protein P3T76_014251 [Phytophthora citrophthora]|uniref:Uncharacterized protein n=1 Tax=Phytophthora citrophthora TaxID=4793 RepID=A0AAD9LBG2_9STRA|nr:hypothetical protein P3T76_014251 [Phytophthora citrophthora]
MDGRKANRDRKPKQLEEQVGHKLDVLSEIDGKELSTLSKHKSPYRQQLKRPKPPAPSPGSPAQRAAKSILKLKEGLLHIETTKWNGESHDEPIVALAQQQPLSRSTPKIDSTSTTRFGEKSLRVKTSERNPSRKKKRPPSPTREERELAKKQERLASWLKANPDVDRTSVEDTGGRCTPYSTEVEARIESAMQCQGPLESGVRLWDDPVRSLLAAEMTSESVFGGAVSTRALPFPSPERRPPPNTLGLLKNVEANVNNEQEPTEGPANVVDSAVSDHQLSDHAQNVFDTAHRQVSNGSVADALATLEAGIRQSLSTSQAHLDAVSGSQGMGFNYSALAHSSATKLQLYYRSRHRRRVNRLVLLQRQWRWWHARRLALKSLQFANQQVKTIQHRFRSWYTHITKERGAVRIQRCFRVFMSQKFLMRFRWVCHLLVERRARRRQVKTRMRTIGKVILLFRRRRRRIALIQGLWRRRCAQAQLMILLAAVKAAEVRRRAWEDEFVATKRERALRHFDQFLINTKRGRELVHWQAEKPWIRFRRLRKHWNELSLSDRTDAVYKLLPNRNFRGVHERALCQMLVGSEKQLPARPTALNVSNQELEFLTTPLTSEVSKLEPGCCPLCAGIREKIKQSYSKLKRRAATLWWTTITYPKEYCISHFWPNRTRRQEQARQQLEDDFSRVLTAFLRVWFRRIDSQTNSPPYSCDWCSEPFATTREFYAHGKCATARAQAEAEWTALVHDLQFVRRKVWWFSRQPQDDPIQTGNQSFDLEADSVRRLRRSRSRRKALRSLVATLEACAVDDSAKAVIPMCLAGFVLRFLDDSKSSHPLIQTAEYQLTQWNSHVGSMQVDNSSLTPRSSGIDSRWIRKDDLRSRLLVGHQWSLKSRWQRGFGRRTVKYQPVPGSGNVVRSSKGFSNKAASKWKEMKLRMKRALPGSTPGSDTVQDTPTAPSTVATY